MSAENGHQEEPLSDLWKGILAGLAAISTFASVVGLSLQLKALLFAGVFLLLLVFEIIVKFNKYIVENIVHKRLKTTDSKQFVLRILATLVWNARLIRWTLWGVLAAILLAALFKETENRLKAPDIGAESIYYMIVLDASEKMNSPFDGHVSKWSAVQSAFQAFLDRSNQRSNYGLVVIGGQNAEETGSDPCDTPTVPLIPVVSKNGRALPPKDLSLANLRTKFEGQQPEGDGSLSEAFFLATNQLQTLPLDKIKIIVLVASSNDICEGAIDWDKLANNIQLVNTAIAIHKELILLDEMADSQVANFADQVNQTSQPVGNSYTYVHVVHNYYELTVSINTILNRLDPDGTPTQMAVATGNPITQIAASPALSQGGAATRISEETEAAIMPQLTTIVPTTCISTDLQDLLSSTLTTAVSVSANFCTPTLTVTPIITFTPTFTFTPTIVTYIPAKPTKKQQDDPAPTNPPVPPASTEDPCCKHCGTTSQACGDSCIALDLTCHQPPGCACQ